MSVELFDSEDESRLLRLGAALAEAEQICEEGYAAAIVRGALDAAHAYARARELLAGLYAAGGWSRRNDG